MNEILEIVNDILEEKELPHIKFYDNIKQSGFSSADMLALLLRLEKLGYNVVNISVQNITDVADLYNKLQFKISDRSIV